MVLHPPWEAAGLTHADRVIPVVRFSEEELGTRTTLPVPLKLRALP
jgi:hypothetical protein